MQQRRSTVRKFTPPLVSLLALGAAACGATSDTDGRDEEANPFAIETFDEAIEAKPPQPGSGDAPPGIGPAAAADAGGTGAGGGSGSPGTGGTGIGTGGFGAGGSGSPGTGGTGIGTGGFGAGGSGVGGGAGTLGGDGGLPGCGNGVIDFGEACDGRDLGGETCESATSGSRPGGALTCSRSCDFDTSGCSGGTSGGTGGFAGAGGGGGLGGGGGDAGFGGIGGAFGSGGSTGGSGGSTGGVGGGPGATPSALYLFDDCSTVTRALLDSSGNGIHAIRTLSVSCAEGIQGQSVEFDEAGDRVEALNAPQFAVDQNLAVAAWVNPERIDGNRPVVLKRRQNDTAFSLRIQNSQAQFSVTLDNGKTFTSRAPIEANTWSHVAGLFDGRFVFLFVNGEQVGQVFAEGSIRDVDVPLRIGATTQTQRFEGRIDNVFISTNPMTPADIAALSCIRDFGSLEVSPASSGPVPAGTEFSYSVDVRNNDIGRCAPRFYSLDAFAPSGISAFGDPPFVGDVAPGQSANFALRVSSDELVEPGLFDVFFFVNEFTDFQQLFGQVQYELAEPTGCHVKTPRELFIRTPAVVDDPLRTSFDGPPEDPRTGAWTFGRLMRQAAPSPEEAADFVAQVFESWLSDQTVNTFTVGARPNMQFILDAWPRIGDGKLDLERSPLRLLGIVNRFDLRNLDQGHAGEGRFVFGVVPFGNPIEFTVILEYQLPASTEAEVLEWAEAWHALSLHPFPSEEYNTALQAITDRFTARDAAPGRPNGSALLTLRSNEIALSFTWQLREFRLGADGFLHPHTVALTPDEGFNFTPTLGNFINANESAILAERHVVPDSFQGLPFAGGAIFNNIDAWFAPNVANNDARHKFSLNTCNGCHGGETNTGFLHVNPRFPGQESFLSGFMTGIDVFDQVSGEIRRLNDLGRRNADLKAIVCPSAALRASSSAARPTLRKGIGRVH